MSPLAEIVPTCAILVDWNLLGALEMSGDNRVNRQVDAALEIHRVHAGRNGLGTFANDRLGENGRRRRAVTGDVVGLGATSLTICAPMFSNLSASSISLATVTPSLVIRGAPNDLSR